MKHISWSCINLAVIAVCVAALWGGRVQAQGSGPAFSVPIDAAVESTGFLVVVDMMRDFVMRVDSTTGNRTIVSGSTASTGPVFVVPVSIAVDVGGALLVVDDALNAIVRVDPTTGNRTIVSEAGTGTGPTFDKLLGIAIEASGALLVADHGLAAVVRVDPSTGNRTIVSGCPQVLDSCPVSVIVGSGMPFMDPVSVAVESTDTLVVVDSTLAAVIRIDPTTGDRTVVSNITTAVVHSYLIQ
jgi:hypothetical protein